ncbi:MAG: replication-associated recombination protein A, partial [bacterium]|nr:replication-associated recombination protein A [bacterium]
ILFIDEIHRFSKAQQDALLPHVERGTVIFIGATTENPSFEVISPLLSRTRVLTLKPLEKSELEELTKRALEDKEKGLGKFRVKLEEEALDFLLEVSGGDARQVLNTLEIAVNLACHPRGGGIKHVVVINKVNIEEAVQKKALSYDKHGDEHYNTISAFIKSMRASNTDAALYYLARMVEAGEDPLFIARRMVVFASEDVASPTALVVANAVFQACQQVGLPECQENLAAGVVYLSQAKKDRSAYEAYMKALEDVRKYGSLPIPMNLRNPSTKLMKSLGYGENYQKYTKEDLMPEKLKCRRYH